MLHFLHQHDQLPVDVDRSREFQNLVQYFLLRQWTSLELGGVPWTLILSGFRVFRSLVGPHLLTSFLFFVVVRDAL